MRRSSIGLLAAALVAAGISAVVIDESDDERTRLKREAERKAARSERRGTRATMFDKFYSPRSRDVPADINRHTGEPHQHSREIARRLRQQAARG